MGWLNDWLVNIVGADKAKWLKGVLAWFLLTLIANLMTPLNTLIINLGLPEVWTSYVLIALNSGSLVAGAIIVVFIGKPIQPQLPESDPTPVPESTNTTDTTVIEINASTSDIASITDVATDTTSPNTPL